MFEKVVSAWRRWRARNKQYAIDRAAYKLGGGVDPHTSHASNNPESPMSLPPQPPAPGP